LLTGQIDVENPDKNYRLSNIESTATCKHHMQDLLSNMYTWIIYIYFSVLSMFWMKSKNKKTIKTDYLLTIYFTQNST